MDSATLHEPRWRPVAEDVFSPAATACGDHRIALFLRDAHGELLCRFREDREWSTLRTLGIPGAPIGGARSLLPADWPIAACATGRDQIHLLARSPEGELLHGTLHGDDWDGFECVGAPAALVGGIPVPMGLASAPTACSRAPGRMDVFAVGAAGALLHSTWEGQGFGEFESLGGVPAGGGSDATAPIAGPISAFSCGPKAMGVVARGSGGDLLLKWWNGASWTAFVSLGAPQERDSVYPAVLRAVPLSGSPAAAGGGSTRLDVVARGPGGDLLHKWWDGKIWSAFQSLGLPHPGSPPAPAPFSGASLACVWGRYRLDVFARAADGKLYNAFWDGSWDHSRPTSQSSDGRI